MKYMTARAMAEACGGVFHGPAEILDIEVTDVTTDSRKVKEGGLFIPIKGETSDGHSYLKQVKEANALLTLSEHAEGVPEGLPYILVESTREAIQDIAGMYLKKRDVPVVGITGSVGKTSTKEMIAAVLSQKYRVHKTPGNFNNNLGLPLTIFMMPEDTEIAVLEMGINHFGEMTRLAETAEPDTMVITNIGTCHLEFLGDRDGVFKAKTECFDYVKLSGSVILNGEDDKLIQVEDVHGKRPVFYGMSPRFRVYADEVEPQGLIGSDCTIHVDEEEFRVRVPMPGEHMIMNALAGAAVGSLYGLTPAEIKAGIEGAAALSGRFHMIETDGKIVIDDCYNANPMSMKAAISALKDAKGRRLAILGDMGELGATEKELHREVGTYAADLGIDCFATVGDLSKEIAAGIREGDSSADIREFASVEELLPKLPDLTADMDAVLVKASHFMKFERIVKALTEKE